MELVATVLGGRAGLAHEPASSIQIFGLHDRLNADRDTAEVVAEGRCDARGERLWLIRSWSLEVLRSLANGGASNLSRDVIMRTGIAGRSGRCAIRIDITGQTVPPKTLDIDAGQSLEVYASMVTCRVMAPLGSVTIAPSQGAGAAPAQAGELVDAIVGASVIPIEESRGIRHASLTRMLAVAVNTQGSLQIPGGARRVQVSQTGAGVASTQWTQAAGPTTALQYVIPWIAGARRTESESILERATHLQTDVDAANARDFCAVFEVRP